MKKDIKRQFRFDPLQMERLEMVVEKMNENDNGITFNMTDAVQVALAFYSKHLGVEEKELHDRLENKGYKIK